MRGTFGGSYATKKRRHEKLTKHGGGGHNETTYVGCEAETRPITWGPRGQERQCEGVAYGARGVEDRPITQPRAILVAPP